ncbi:MAG: patatin-like phospholipase family protein [Burkholderiaceae bacterium]|nr:MAG: patatin-like phospholipase family protein [Burkholderiaceae bacterium]
MVNFSLGRFIPLLFAVLLAACQTPKPQPDVPVVKVEKPVKVALVLGGGAARGFAHIGVIKVLEAQGIVPDLIVGTSAGSAVGALYATGMNGFELQRAALSMNELEISDWMLPGSRGVLKGEALQNYINRMVSNQPLEKLKRPLAVVATELQSGQAVVFQYGNTGMAVRASSSVPGVFQPVLIGGKEYVDGGLVSPIPVRIARKLGADVVIAVDISAKPEAQSTDGTLEMLLQTFAIMGQTIGGYELQEADVVIRPALNGTKGTDFQGRNLSILEGEKAALAQIVLIKQKIQNKKVE